MNVPSLYTNWTAFFYFLVRSLIGRRVCSWARLIGGRGGAEALRRGAVWDVIAASECLLAGGEALLSICLPSHTQTHQLIHNHEHPNPHSPPNNPPAPQPGFSVSHEGLMQMHHSPHALVNLNKLCKCHVLKGTDVVKDHCLYFVVDILPHKRLPLVSFIKLCVTHLTSLLHLIISPFPASLCPNAQILTWIH